MQTNALSKCAPGGNRQPTFTWAEVGRLARLGLLTPAFFAYSNKCWGEKACMGMSTTGMETVTILSTLLV